MADTTAQGPMVFNTVPLHRGFHRKNEGMCISLECVPADPMCDHCGKPVRLFKKHPKADCPRQLAETIWIIDNDTED